MKRAERFGKTEQKTKYGIPFLMFLLCQMMFLALLVYVYFLPHENTSFDDENCMMLKSGWYYDDFSGTIGERFSLSEQMESNIEGGIRISNELPEESEKVVEYIGEFCVFQDCRIYIDEVLVYDSSDEALADSIFFNTKGSYWVFVNLPPDSAGKKVTLEMTSSYKDYQNVVSTLFLGTKTGIIFYLLRENIVQLICCAVFVCLGIGLCVWNFFMRRRLENGKSLYYLASFSFWIGLWIFSESYVTQIFISNAVFSTVISFVGIRMCMISFLSYTISLAVFRWRKFQKTMIYALYLEAMVTLGMQLFQVLDFYQSFMPFVVLAVAVILVISVNAVIEVAYYKNFSAKYILICFGILAVGGILEIYNFCFGSRTNMGDFMVICLIASVNILAVVEVRRTRAMIKRGKEAEYYEKLAMTDFMTGFYNRTAMHRDMKEHNLTLSSLKNSAAVVCDVNNLKYTNDTFGHAAGDELIEGCTRLFKEVFGKLGKCYRSGGDEFICLICGYTREQIEDAIKEFELVCSKEKNQAGGTVSAAVGYACYDMRLDSDMESIIKRADAAMYEMKSSMKNAST